ncbi:flagellar protein [Radiobacillus kanasensis]|uniref:TIGR02530 family flagellar biosynthesis protein n=1 Tax=Radiobacillus kanasensis TaxID=2844358 RepID=UPI001E52A1EF|nr:TIGR02530 family flagellar biosynthesis protein [Radiobacillus kanasensis]UFU01029.1 flagellar protein [Radiobacillus kanasensis]
MDQRIQQLQTQALQLPRLTKKSPVVPTGQTTTAFKDVLQEAQGLKVSKHAQERLQQRNITIDPSQWQKISEKVSEAKQKGITESLVITNDAALLVSTKNHTVVTAMDRSEVESKIFTNINGAILM